MVCVMMHRSEMQVSSVKFWRCSPISVHAQGAHNALECVQACDRGVQKSAEAGRSHAIRAGSQPRAPAGPQHERFASCERRGVRGACTRRGHTFRGAGRAREAGGAPRLAEDVGLVSLGPA